MKLHETFPDEEVPAEAAPGRDRQSDKRRELATHTLSALAELGFGRINLREVAARSGVSLGSIHYYFTDKTDLLIQCMRLYKDAFVRRLERVIDSSVDAAELAQRFPDALAGAIERDAQTHRLWYDMRAQALFEPAFQPAVEEIERRLVGLTARFLARVRAASTDTADSADSAHSAEEDALGFYLLLDSWFRYALQRHLAGDPGACDALRRRLAQIARAC